MVINGKIKELRLKCDMKQEELAEKLGVSRQTINKWESGGNCPDCENLVNICELFNVSSDEILGIEIVENLSSEIELCENLQTEIIDEETVCGSSFEVITKWLKNLCVVMSIGVFAMILLMFVVLI